MDKSRERWLTCKERDCRLKEKRREGERKRANYINVNVKKEGK
jgi:hypothetical protein